MRDWRTLCTVRKVFAFSDKDTLLQKDTRTVQLLTGMCCMVLANRNMA